MHVKITRFTVYLFVQLSTQLKYNWKKTETIFFHFSCLSAWEERTSSC